MGLFIPEDKDYNEAVRQVGFNRYKQLLSAHYNLIDATIRRKIKQGRFDEQYVSNAIERSLLPKMYSGRRLWELRGIIYGGYRNLLLNTQH